MPDLRQLLIDYLATLDRLRPHGIESISDFAEYLFAAALGRERVTRGQNGYDLTTPSLGRVQVKARRLPPAGRIEARLHLRNVGVDSCDHIAAVIFENDLQISKATVAPHNDVWQIIQAHPDPQRKVRFDLIFASPHAQDCTNRLREVMKGK